MKIKLKKVALMGVALAVAMMMPMNAWNAVYAEEMSDETNDESVDDEAAPTVASFPLRIQAINPGYTVDGVANTGEFIEIMATGGEAELPISLGGVSLRYTNSAGTVKTLYEFEEGDMMTGETLLLRLSSSPVAELADANYTTSLALGAGPLELVYGDEVWSSLCWDGSSDCYAKFKSGSGVSLVWSEDSESYVTANDYVPFYDAVSPSLVIETAAAEVTESKCRGLRFSEILTYYESEQAEQFVEIYNGADEAIDLSSCILKYKSKTVQLDGVVEAQGYFVRYATDFKMTKNPTSENTLTIVDVDGSVVDELVYKHGQKKGVAYAQFEYNEDGSENWQQTYAPTPGEANVFQEHRSCEDGKVLNVSTGNCIKVTSTVATACPAGKYRNPLTGRCKSYATTTQKECKEGYERNAETGRCHKIKSNTGADYGIEVAETGGEVNFVAVGIIVGLVALAGGYVVWQFRGEIIGAGRKVVGKIRKK